MRGPLQLQISGWLAFNWHKVAKGLAFRRLGALWFTLLALAAQPALAETRIALVIANSAYTAPSLAPTPDTRADAAVLAKALTVAGFTVRLATDLDRDAMRRAVADFSRDLGAAGADGLGFLYFAGQGETYAFQEQSYLLPVDADVRSDEDLPYFGLATDDLLNAVEAARAKAAFVVFDTCGFAAPTSRGRTGLLREKARANMVIAFSHRPDDGRCDVGLYGRTLAAQLQNPGMTSELMFLRSQVAVKESTAGQQVPAIFGLMNDPVKF